MVIIKVGFLFYRGGCRSFQVFWHIWDIWSIWKKWKLRNVEASQFCHWFILIQPVQSQTHDIQSNSIWTPNLTWVGSNDGVVTWVCSIRRLVVPVLKWPESQTLSLYWNCLKWREIRDINAVDKFHPLWPYKIHLPWETSKSVDEEILHMWGALLSWKWLQAMESGMVSYRLAICWNIII